TCAWSRCATSSAAAKSPWPACWWARTWPGPWRTSRKGTAISCPTSACPAACSSTAPAPRSCPARSRSWPPTACRCGGPSGAEMAPVVAVVGRPNVGKSTLVNRILGRREAIVEEQPGVTRDRVAYDATWGGRRFTVLDTGGWEPKAEGLAAAVADQARLAVDAADVVLVVVDATVGATDTDEAVVNVLRRSRKPVVLAANKVDD